MAQCRFSKKQILTMINQNDPLRFLAKGKALLKEDQCAPDARELLHVYRKGYELGKLPRGER